MILLTFNIINSDFATKSGKEISTEKRTEISVKNVNSILRILEIYDTKATFFVEISLCESLNPLIKKIVSKGHEISLYNQNSSLADIKTAKAYTEETIEKSVRGIRQKDISISLEELKNSEFSYVSNIENANILFPLKKLQRDTEIKETLGMSIIPESISPYSRIPYNDFTFQMIPQELYQNMVIETLKRDEFVLIYLDSRQFTDFSEFPFQIPFYRKYNSGRKMEDKLETFLHWLNEKELAVSRMKDYIF
ncbi:MAG: polysaccharide deacetylase [Bergeyella sp.]